MRNQLAMIIDYQVDKEMQAVGEDAGQWTKINRCERIKLKFIVHPKCVEANKRNFHSNSTD